MARLLNATPMDMNAQVYGHNYTLPAGKITTIKELLLKQGETHGSEDVARKLLEQLAPRGLRLLDEDNPMPQDEHVRLSLKQFVRFTRQQLKDFNDLNLKQASESLATLLPTDELMAMRDMVKEVEAGIGKQGPETPDFVSQEELKSIQNREVVNAIAKLQALTAAIQTGDINAIRAAAGVGHAVEVDAARAAEPDPSRDIIEPVRPSGKSPGRVPTKARQAGQPGARRPQSRAQEAAPAE